MLSKPIFLIFLSCFSLAKAASDDDRILTDLFKDIVTKKAPLTPETLLGRILFKNQDFNVRINDVRVVSQWTKDKIGSVSAQFTEKPLAGVRNIRLTVHQTNGALISNDANIQTTDGDHKGSFRTAFKGIQFEFKIKWSRATKQAAGKVHLEAEAKALWSDGIETNWANFENPIQPAMERDGHRTERTLSDMAFTKVARDWWEVTLYKNRAFFIAELERLFPK